MAILTFVLGMLAGFILGFVTFVNVQLMADKRAAANGVIKLDGEIYKLEKIEL